MVISSKFPASGPEQLPVCPSTAKFGKILQLRSSVGVRREIIRNVFALCSRRRLKNLFVLPQLAKLCAKASNIPHEGAVRAIIHTQK